MGGDVTDAVEKQCPFFYMIDPIMHDYASIKSPPLSDDLDWENLGIEDEFMDNSEDSTYADTNEKEDDSPVFVCTTCGDDIHEVSLAE
jgi:hypothetical protein